MIPRLRVEFQPTRALFFRTVAQYRAERRAALQHPATGTPLLADGAFEPGISLFTGLTHAKPGYQQVRASLDAPGGSVARSDGRIRVSGLRTGTSEAIVGSYVSPSYFTTLGVQPALGRPWRDGDSNVAVVSWNFWQSKMGGAADAVGRQVADGGDDVALPGGEFTVVLLVLGVVAVLFLLIQGVALLMGLVLLPFGWVHSSGAPGVLIRYTVPVSGT